MNMGPAPLQQKPRWMELTARFMTAATSDSNVAWRSRCRLDCSASSSMCTAITPLLRDRAEVGEMSLIENQCDGATGDGEEPQVLPVGGKLLPDLIEGADPGAGQVAHVGEVDGKRERAASAGSQQPPAELNGGADIHRAGCPDVGDRTVGSEVHGEGWPGIRDAGTGAAACAHDGGPAEPVPQPHDGAPGAGRGAGLRRMADLQFVYHLPGHHQPVAAAGSGRVRP